MKYVFHLIFLLLFAVIQPTWLEYTEVFGAKANLFLVYTVVVSCYCGKKEGAVTGFVFGLILDLFIGRIIGLNTVLMMILAFLTANFCEKVIRKNTLLITILIVAITIPVYELLYYTIAFLGDLEFKTAFLRTLLPECLCCIIATIPLYWIVKKAAKTLWDDKGEGIG